MENEEKKEPEGNSVAFRFLISGALKVSDLTHGAPIELLKPTMYGLKDRKGGQVLGSNGQPITRLIYKRTNKITTLGRVMYSMILEADKKLKHARPYDLAMTAPFAHHDMIVFRLGYVLEDAIRKTKVKRGYDPNRQLYVLERRLAGNPQKRLDRGGPFPGPGLKNSDHTFFTKEQYVDPVTIPNLSHHPHHLPPDPQSSEPCPSQHTEPGLASLVEEQKDVNEQACPDLSLPSEKTG